MRQDVSRRLSRRRFLALSGVMVAGVCVGCGLTSGQAPVEDDGQVTVERVEPTSVPEAAGGDAEVESALTVEPTAEPTVAEAPTAEPQVRCPRGMVNDPYPGRCPRYVDENGNGICDLSEPI